MAGLPNLAANYKTITHSLQPVSRSASPNDTRSSGPSDASRKNQLSFSVPNGNSNASVADTGDRKPEVGPVRSSDDARGRSPSVSFSKNGAHSRPVLQRKDPATMPSTTSPPRPPPQNRPSEQTLALPPMNARSRKITEESRDMDITSGSFPEPAKERSTLVKIRGAAYVKRPNGGLRLVTSDPTPSLRRDAERGLEEFSSRANPADSVGTPPIVDSSRPLPRANDSRRNGLEARMNAALPRSTDTALERTPTLSSSDPVLGQKRASEDNLEADRPAAVRRRIKPPQPDATVDDLLKVFEFPLLDGNRLTGIASSEPQAAQASTDDFLNTKPFESRLPLTPPQDAQEYADPIERILKLPTLQIALPLTPPLPVPRRTMGRTQTAPPRVSGGVLTRDTLRALVLESLAGVPSEALPPVKSPEEEDENTPVAIRTLGLRDAVIHSLTGQAPGEPNPTEKIPSPLLGRLEPDNYTAMDDWEEESIIIGASPRRCQTPSPGTMRRASVIDRDSSPDVPLAEQRRRHREADIDSSPEVSMSQLATGGASRMRRTLSEEPLANRVPMGPPVGRRAEGAYSVHVGNGQTSSGQQSRHPSYYVPNRAAPTLGQAPARIPSTQQVGSQKAHRRTLPPLPRQAPSASYGTWIQYEPDSTLTPRTPYRRNPDLSLTAYPIGISRAPMNRAPGPYIMSAPDPSTAVRRITKIVDRKGRPIPENGGRESKSNVLFQEASGTWRSMKLQNAQVTDTAGWVRSAIRVKTTTDAAHKRLRELGIGMYGKRSGSPGSVAPSQNATPSQKVTPSRSVTPSKKGSAVRSTANVQAEAADVDESMRMIIAMENTVLPVRLRGRTKTQEEYDQELARLISDQLNGFRRRRG